MRVLIVEPHGDDAFISCSSAMLKQDIKSNVVTFADRDSHRLGDVYDSVHKTTWLDAPDVHYDFRIKYSTHDIHKRFLAGENLYDSYIKDMDNLLLDKETDASNIYIDIFFKLLDYTAVILEEDYDLAILPLGLFHPNHYAVHKLSKILLSPDIPKIYYVDKPYIEKRYVQEILKCSPYSLFTAPVEDKETRAKIFKSLYPTEQGLLRYSSQTILEWKDIYAVPKEFEENDRLVEFLNIVSDMKKGDRYETLVCHVPEG